MIRAKVFWAFWVILLAFVGVWGVFYAGHLLNASWPVTGVISAVTSWWTIPFVITACTSLITFFNSISFFIESIRTPRNTNETS